MSGVTGFNPVHKQLASSAPWCQNRNEAGPAGISSLHHLDLARPPLLGEERFERAVEPQEQEPAFLRISLDPVAALDSLWLLGAEVHRRGAVLVRLGGGRGVVLAAGARVALWRVEH